MVNHSEEVLLLRLQVEWQEVHNTETSAAKFEGYCLDPIGTTASFVVWLVTVEVLGL